MARKNLFDRLPECWKRLDHLYGGVLEKYLGVFDDEYDDIRDKIESVLKLRSPNTAADEYIPLLGRLVGYEWDYDKPYNWNRQRIMIAIRRYSYKGTLDAVDDVVTEAGGDEWWVLDMASTVVVPSRQGDLGTPNCYLVAPDYHHPGAYELQVTAAIDDWDVINDHLDRNTAAGEYWYLKAVPGTIPGDMAVRGGLLTMDSLLDLTKTEIQLHEGTSDNPLSELDAVIQACDDETPVPLFIPDLAAWMDSSYMISLDGSGDVNDWGDLSDNNHGLEEGTTAYNPAYVLDVLNGKPAVRFNQHWLWWNPAWDINPNYTVFLVLRFDDEDMPSGEHLVTDGDESGSSGRIELYSGTHPDIRCDTHAPYSQAIDAPNGVILRFRITDTPSQHIAVNGGTEENFTNATSGGMTNWQNIGAYHSNPTTTTYIGDYFAILIYNRSLNSTEIDRIESYLSIRFGISLS